MKRQIFKILTLLIIFLTTTEKSSFAQDKKHLDFIMVIENGSEEYDQIKEGKAPAVFNHTFIPALKQKIFIIAHSGLLAMLMSLSQDSYKNLPIHNEISNAIDDLKKNWEVKINNTLDWVIFNPKNNPIGKDLTSLGFNNSLLQDAWLLEKSLITDLEKKQFKPHNINNFKQLFLADTQIHKRIYLAAHGNSAKSPNPLIAGMQRKQYADFIEFLNPTTDFLNINTCFAGGFNSVAFHEKEIKEGVVSSIKIEFPIALAATTEAESWMSRDFNFVEFFKKLDQYLSKPSTQLLKAAVDHVAAQGKGYGIQAPLIRFPGASEFFRAISLDKEVTMLTMVSMRAYEMDPKNKSQGVLKPFKIENSLLLMYPALVNISLEISSNTKGILSMIPGNGIHIIEKLISNNRSDIIDNVKELFINEKVKGNIGKTFLIKEIIVSNLVFKNVAIAIDTNLTKTVFAELPLSLQREFEAPFVYLSFKDLPERIFSNKESFLRDKELAQKKLSGLISIPNPEALRQATGGMQSISMIDKAISEFYDNITQARDKITIQAINDKGKIINEFEVKKDIAELSTTIKNTVGPDQVIQIKEISAANLKRIFELMTQIRNLGIVTSHKVGDIKKVVETLNFSNLFDAKELTALLNAANYLDVKPLIDPVAFALAKKVTPGTWEATKNMIKERKLHSKVIYYYWKLNQQYSSNTDIWVSVQELLDLGHKFEITKVGPLGREKLKLDLSNLGINNLIGLNNVPGINTVEVLRLSGNQLTNIQPNTFQGLTNLEWIDLSGNKLTDINPKTFQGLIKLEMIFLNTNKLTNIQPNTFQGLTKLETIALGGNQLTNINPTIFQGLTNLEVIDLRGNQLAPESKEALKKFAQEKELDELF